MTDADRYFAMDAKPGEGVTGGAYVEVDKDVAPVEFVPGLVFRPVVGDQLMANYVRYDPDTVAPLHTHEEEQITVVIEGSSSSISRATAGSWAPGWPWSSRPGFPTGPAPMTPRASRSTSSTRPAGPSSS
jgi:hypothetical protein